MRDEARMLTERASSVLAMIQTDAAPPGPDLLVDEPGVFFRPTKADPVWKKRISLMDGVRVKFSVTPGHDTYEEVGSKLLFLGANMRDLSGFGIVRKGQLILRSGFGIKMGRNKPKAQRPFSLVPGKRVVVELEWRRGFQTRLSIDGGWGLSCPCPGAPPTHAWLTIGGDGSEAEPVQEGFTFQDLTVEAL